MTDTLARAATTARGSAGPTVHLDVLGARVSLRTRTAEQAAAVAADWSRCLVATRGAEAPRLVVDSTLPLTREVRQRLASNLNVEGVERLAGEAVMLHAAGLATDDGRVLALVAESGTGKTTAAAHLCRDAFGYVTDETVVVLDDGRVLPFAKPLSVVVDPAQRSVKELHGPDDLGLRRHPDGPLTLGGVVLLVRRPDHVGAPRVEPVALLDALVRLVEHTSALVHLDRPLQTLAGLLSRGPGPHELVYAEIGGCTELLAGLVAQGTEAPVAPAAPVAAWEPLEVPDRPVPTGPRGSLVVVPSLDGVVVGDEALLLHGDTPMRLGPLGLTLWRAAAAGARAADLPGIAVAAHGDHPDAAALVRRGLAELVAAGLVRDTQDSHDPQDRADPRDRATRGAGR